MQRYFAKNLEKNVVTLQDSDLHHIKTVMRMKANDNIEVVYKKDTYLCQIMSDYKIEILNKLDEDNELKINIILACALVQEQKLDLIIGKLTELGINTFIPLKMNRSIVKLDSKKEAKKIERWTKIAKEASEQSKRNIIPNITNIMTIKDLVKLEATKKIVLSTKEKNNVLNISLQSDTFCDSIIIVTGPEGGITNEEETFLNQHGFKSVSLGSRILRVETAAIYITSIINYINMR